MQNWTHPEPDRTLTRHFMVRGAGITGLGVWGVTGSSLPQTYISLKSWVSSLKNHTHFEFYSFMHLCLFWRGNVYLLKCMSQEAARVFAARWRWLWSGFLSGPQALAWREPSPGEWGSLISGRLQRVVLPWLDPRPDLGGG